VVSLATSAERPDPLSSGDLDGGHQRPFLTIDPDCYLELFGCVPGRLSG